MAKVDGGAKDEEIELSINILLHAYRRVKVKVETKSDEEQIEATNHKQTPKKKERRDIKVRSSESGERERVDLPSWSRDVFENEIRGD